VAITEDLMRVTLIALLAGAMTGWPLTTHASQDTAQRPMKTCEAESKGRRLTSSHGSILDVSGQKQQCNDGKWVHDPANGPQDPLDAKRKPCVDAFKQEYASGLLRETTDGFERCSDGKWVTKTP